MRGPIDRSTRHLEERHRRIMRVSLVASVALHVLVLVWFRADVLIPLSPFAAAGPRAGDDRAAPGGGTELINFEIQQPRTAPEVAVPQPIPVPVADRPEIEVQVEDPKPQLATTSIQFNAGAGVRAEGRGAGVGAGIEGGTGRGDGGTGEEGRFRVLPPSPRGLILPPSDRPGRVKGMEVDVWVFVNDRGRVVADSTRLDPSTGDRKFDDRLKEQAAEWVFEPARRGGRVVAEWFRYTVVL